MKTTVPITLGMAGALMIVLAVGLLDAPVNQLGRAVGSAMRQPTPPFNIDFGLPFGLSPRFVAVDNAVGLLLLAAAFFGGVPAGVLGIVAARTRIRQTILAVLLTIAGTAVGTEDYLSSPFARYQIATIAIGCIAIPAWR